MADTNAGTAAPDGTGQEGTGQEGTLPTVAIEGPAARALAESAAVIGDLQFVMECCKRLLTELAVPEDDRDPLVPQALWSAALTGYARCFGKGSRPGLTVDDVRAQPPGRAGHQPVRRGQGRGRAVAPALAGPEAARHRDPAGQPRAGR